MNTKNIRSELTAGASGGDPSVEESGATKAASSSTSEQQEAAAYEEDGGGRPSGNWRRPRSCEADDHELQRMRNKNRTNSKRFRDRKKSYMDSLFEEKYRIGKLNNDLREDNDKLRLLLQEALAENEIHRQTAAAAHSMRSRILDHRIVGRVAGVTPSIHHDHQPLSWHHGGIPTRSMLGGMLPNNTAAVFLDRSLLPHVNPLLDSGILVVPHAIPRPSSASSRTIQNLLLAAPRRSSAAMPLALNPDHLRGMVDKEEVRKQDRMLEQLAARDLEKSVQDQQSRLLKNISKSDGDNEGRVRSYHGHPLL